MTETAEELRRHRLRRVMTIATLAEAANVAPKTISDIENGKVVPKLRTIRRLSEALGVEPADVTEFAAALDFVGEIERAAA